MVSYREKNLLGPNEVCHNSVSLQPGCQEPFSQTPQNRHFLGSSALRMGRTPTFSRPVWTSYEALKMTLLSGLYLIKNMSKLPKVCFWGQNPGIGRSGPIRGPTAEKLKPGHLGHARTPLEPIKSENLKIGFSLSLVLTAMTC